MALQMPVTDTTPCGCAAKMIFFSFSIEVISSDDVSETFRRCHHRRTEEEASSEKMKKKEAWVLKGRGRDGGGGVVVGDMNYSGRLVIQARMKCWRKNEKCSAAGRSGNVSEVLAPPP